MYEDMYLCINSEANKGIYSISVRVHIHKYIKVVVQVVEQTGVGVALIAALVKCPRAKKQIKYTYKPFLIFFFEMTANSEN